MKTRAAAVQLEFEYCSTPQEFIDRVREPIERAAEAGVQLILLPHQISFMLFGMFDFDATANDSLDDLAQHRNAKTSDWLAERAGYVHEFYLHTFQSLATRTETWLVPGTVIEPEADVLYLTAFLFNPVGEIVGRQRQLNIPTQEQAWGIISGDTSRVFETEIGDLGIIVAEDVQDSQIAGTLAARGAKVLLHPTAEHAASDGFQRSVQANRVFGIKANLGGENFSAGSVIYAPTNNATQTGGVLAHAEQKTDTILIAELDFDS